MVDISLATVANSATALHFAKVGKMAIPLF